MTPCQHRVLEAVDRLERDQGRPVPALKLAITLQAATAAERNRLDTVVADLCQHELLASHQVENGAGLSLTRYGRMALTEVRKGRPMALSIDGYAERAGALLDEIRALEDDKDAGPALLRLYLHGHQLLAEWEAAAS